MADITLGQIWRHLVTSLSTILAVMGILWFSARPHAQAFVQTEIQKEKFASQQSLDAIEQKALELETAIESVQRQQADQALQQGIIGADVGTIKQIQKENRDDIRAILKGIAELNNE